MGNEARDGLIARCSILLHPKFGVGDVHEAWKLGEDYVAAMEAEPDKPRQCPCCTKLVVCCLKHYQLTEPGKPCLDCRRVE